MKKTTLYVKGMHCPSCDILVTDKFQEVDNVSLVKANHKTQQVEVCYRGTLDQDLLNSKINEYGYEITTPGAAHEVSEPFSKRISDATVITVILFIIYFIANELQLLPEFAGSSLTYGTVFILGLVASTSTCMATSGALFLATIGKMHRTDTTTSQNIGPAISFNLGRVISYTVFGFLLGLVGKTISTDLGGGQLLTIITAALMILIGLDMLKIFSFSKLIPSSLSKRIFTSLESKLIKNPKKTSFLLGAVTYYLPCGFTQAVQIYALGIADPFKSAAAMGIFALGTIPALLAIAFISSFSMQHKFYPMFSKVMGALVLLIGLSYAVNTLNVYGVNLPSFPATSQPKASGLQPEMENGVQVVRMSVDARGYTPNMFVLKQGVPVKWILQGENVFGCQAALVAPKLNVNQTLEPGENVITFTPKEKGTIKFSCRMGMYDGAFEVI